MQTVKHDIGTNMRPSAPGGDDWRLERLIERLPTRVRAAVRFLRRSAWLRIPVAVLLMGGGLLGFLPIFGFWMLPAGLVLLADDVPPLASLRTRILDWVERRRPQWLAAPLRLPN
jgi:hypothetical protein